MSDGRFRYLAGAVLDDDVAVLANGAGLLRVGLGSAGVSLRLELVLFAVRHLLSSDQDQKILYKFQEIQARKESVGARDNKKKKL